MKLRLLEDVGQKVACHRTKHNQWDKMGVVYERQPLPVGDYVLVDENVQDVIDRKTKRGLKPKKMDFLGTYTACVDSKKDIYELVMDICGEQHDRFRDECILAKNNGIQLYVVVENDFEVVKQRFPKVVNHSIYRLEDLHKWTNKRLWITKNGKQMYPRATRGITLQKACMTMEKEYGVKFLFCKSNQSAELIIDLLTGGNNVEQQG